MTTDEIGIFIRLWEGESSVSLEPGQEHSIDRAVHQFLETGRDSILYLTTRSGEQYHTLASNVRSWLVSTPQGRARSAELEKAATDEERALREAAGLPWMDE